LDRVRQQGSDETFHNSTVLVENYESYLTVRYAFFLPHVFGALVWWNFYFLQLVPALRRKYKAFHRWNGRILLLAVLSQVISGLGMAWFSPSSNIKLVSLFMAVSAVHCTFYVGYYARAKDIVRHKHWAIRLTGYMQTIAAQRFWLVVLIGTHQAGSTFLYPPLDDTSTQFLIDSIVSRMFDDSFVLAILSSILITEWFLASDIGMRDHAGSRVKGDYRLEYQPIGNCTESASA